MEKTTKVKCTDAKGTEFLEEGAVYTVADERDGKCLINVFEGKENEYAPMYGAYEKRRFEIVEQ